MSFHMPDSYYDPPESPGPCCAAGEDDEDHDVAACLQEQAEAAAEAKAEDFMGQDDWNVEAHGRWHPWM